MPVTAKLSKRFYDVLGEDIANELVEWFNMVDATYRADLRELNELNFARFDAKVEQRFAEGEARLERRLAELEANWERRFIGLEVRLQQLDARIEQRTLELRQEILGLRADTDVNLARTRADLIKWMFVFWLGSAGVSVLLRLL